MTKVSIIVPVYNSEQFLGRCLDSIMAQTYPDIQIVIINDGSTDKSEMIIQNYANKRFEIKYIFQKNAGPSVARNNGILEADGEFISFADADDYLDSTAIESMMRQQEALNSDIVIGNHMRHEKNKIVNFDVVLPEYLSQEVAIDAFLNKKIRVGCCGKIYRAEILKQKGLFFPVDRYGEDIYHLFKCIMSGARITWLNEVVYHVVDTEDSICNVFSTKFLYMLDTMKEMRNDLITNNLWSRHEKAFKKYYASQLYFLINYGIRFNSDEFLKGVLEKNIYPNARIKICIDKGLKVLLDAIAFGFSKKVYIKLKIKKRFWENKKAN